MSRALVVVGASAVMLVAAACTEETIVLANVPADDGGAGDKTWQEHPRCVNNSDCTPGTFCERRGCADTAGTCEPYPVLCGDEAPVCGCDGVTYWNDCLRRAAGLAMAHPGECTEGRPCDDGARKCPKGALCAKLVGFDDLGPSCHVPVGRCWVLPATCPPPTRADRWDECAPPERALHCADTCTAIRTERSFVRAISCHD